MDKPPNTLTPDTDIHDLFNYLLTKLTSMLPIYLD